MQKARISAFVILIVSLALGWFVYSSESDPNSEHPIQYGLDLSGGTHLVYQADVSNLSAQDIDPAMESLRNVIERRVNAFGVSEPLVQVEQGGFGTGQTDYRLIVELPGITDTETAIEQIGETPLLEFKLRDPNEQPPTDLFGNDTATTSDEPSLDTSAFGTSSDTPNAATSSTSTEAATTSTSSIANTRTESPDQGYIDTGLTGRLLEGAQLQFGAGGQGGGLGGEPVVLIDWNEEGTELFAEITTENVGESLAIFLDGQLLSSPVIQTPITGGTAQISGNFTPEEARELVRDLNLGALPVPIELVSTQTIGASLGEAVRSQGVQAGIVGLITLSIFLLLWYRLPGAIAIYALALYILLMLSIFKVVPVTLTAAGIAGFILSIGLAVDANVLIFERLKEELSKDEQDADMQEAVNEAFSRAWPSIRDANLSSLISAVILYWLGTSLVKGFALTFGVGVMVSVVTAVSVSRTLLLALSGQSLTDAKEFLYSSGFYKTASRKAANDTQA